MSQLNEIFRNSTFNKTHVQFPHAKSSHNLWEYDYELSVELDNLKKIKAISHNSVDELWTPYFELYCQFCLKKSIAETLRFDFSTLYLEQICQDFEFIDLYEEGNLPFLFLPSFLMKKIHFKLNGEETNLCDLEGQSSNSLICRCFGVFRDQIEEKINSGEVKNTKDVTDLLLAGGGCSSCVEDIEEIIAQTLPQENLELSEEILISLNKYLKALYVSKIFFKVDCPSISYTSNSEIKIICKDKFTDIEKSKIEKKLKENFATQFNLDVNVVLVLF
ncbi:MAG: (2Fe-2S)-binding protein [Halobacteriovoraceae bacterium]|nr:(2Fe-2S)-binding protein [Halobacteriovoraceae bacterium]